MVAIYDLWTENREGPILIAQESTQGCFNQNFTPPLNTVT